MVMAIRRKNPAEIDKMRVAGSLVAKILSELAGMCSAGRTTEEFERRSAEMIAAAGAVALFKGVPQYAGGMAYPATVCVSVNEEVVHGIPGPRLIVAGDIVSFDVGVKIEGFCGDAALTVPVGQVSPDAQRLIDVTRRTLDVAIETIRPGLLWSAVAAKMERTVHEAGFSVVTDFVGHGIGTEMWEEPKLQNFVSRELLRNDILLEAGMVLAVEPMVNMGLARIKVLSDGWTAITADKKPSAHFEHSVAITESGPLILTVK